MDHVRQQHPSLAQSTEATYELARAGGTVRSEAQLRIPVVIHLVWKDPDENLPDSVIADQLRILNEDFNQHNKDQASLRPIFQPEAGNARIEFVLDRIIRTQTSVLFKTELNGSNLLEEVKHADQGGSDAIDPEHYLNIWICHIQPITLFGIQVGQILGFAFPPNDLDHWPANSGAPRPDEDGVVVDYRTIGSNNPNRLDMGGSTGDMTVKGRTLTHEIGHYFGLRHIWGDGGFLGNPNDCQQTDGIDDTPFANAQSTFDCDKTRNSCPDMDPYYGEDVPDLVENFMDYAQEDCMNMFTNGQATLMRNILAGPRNGLVMSATGLGELKSVESLTIYPNPTTGPLHLAFDATEPLTAEFRLWTPDGRLAAWFAGESYTAGRHTVTLPVQRGTPGLYLLEMTSGTGRKMARVIFE